MIKFAHRPIHELKYKTIDVLRFSKQKCQECEINPEFPQPRIV